MKIKEIINGFFGKGSIYPSFLAFWLDFPLRKLIISPKELSKRLYLKNNLNVLEIGSGPGFFSVEIARQIPDGRLELFDIQKEMLEKARRKVRKYGLSNTGFTQGNAERLPYKNNKFDLIFLVTVLGEISDKKKALKSIYSLLKPLGLLSITEQKGDPDFIPISELISTVEEEGFEFVESFKKKTHYTANFRKPKIL